MALSSSFDKGATNFSQWSKWLAAATSSHALLLGFGRSESARGKNEFEHTGKGNESARHKGQVGLLIFS